MIDCDMPLVALVEAVKTDRSNGRHFALSIILGIYEARRIHGYNPGSIIFLAAFVQSVQDERLFRDSMRHIASTAPDWQISIADVVSTLFNPDFSSNLGQ